MIEAIIITGVLLVAVFYIVLMAAVAWDIIKPVKAVPTKIGAAKVFPRGDCLTPEDWEATGVQK